MSANLRKNILQPEAELEALRRENERLKLKLEENEKLLEVAPAYFGFLSPEGRALRLNDLALKSANARREEILGKYFWECPWWTPLPKSAKRVKEYVKQAQQGHSIQVDIEYYAVIDGVGQTRWVEMGAKPIFDSHGEVYEIAMTGVDIHERKRLERTLEVERENLKVLFDEASAIVAIMKGPEHRFEYVNPSHIELLGLDATGKTVAEAQPELIGSEIGTLLDRVYQTGQSVRFKEKVAKIGKEDRFFDFAYVPRKNAEGVVDGVMCLATDITEPVRARSTLENERDMRERFVATLTHDLRTPLTAARMTAQLIGRHGLDPATTQKFVGRIIDSVDRSDQMIRDLLDANRIKAGETLPLDITEFKMNDVLVETLEELSTIHGDRFVLRSAEEIKGHWSRNGVRRIVENLCVNAIKYGSTTQPVTITLSSHEGEAEIAIRNEGNPIPKAELSELFNPFRRSKAAELGMQRGWGLGLTLVKGFSESMGGSVRVESSPKYGTTFYVRLPLDSRAR